MAACDAIVSLRSPTMGETSGSAIRALSLGKPLVVSDVGWFAELPADAVVKVPVDEHEEDTLLAALEALADPAVRAAMGERARELVEREHRVDRVAEAYAAALETDAGGAVVEERVLHEVASAASRGGHGRRRRGRSRGEAARGRAWRLARRRRRPGTRGRARPRDPDVGLGRRPRRSSPPVSATPSRGGSSRPGSWSTSSSTPSSPRASPTPGASCSAASTPPPTGSSTRRSSSPAWALFDRVPQAYAAAKAINAVVVSLAAIPAYLLARRVCSRPFAFGAAVLAMSVPTLLFAGMLMTENAFYPAFLLAALAMVAVAGAARPAPNALPARRRSCSRT